MLMFKYHYTILVISSILLFSACGNPNIKDAEELNTSAILFPDYTNITIPYNIAPMNFIIKDSASAYYVEISSDEGKTIRVKSSDGNIQMPINAWSRLLEANKGKTLRINVYAENNDDWQHYTTIENTIAEDNIDSYLVYRFINAANILWTKMGIYQRNLQNFTVKPIMDNSLTDQNCMHCHSFAANNSNTFMLHMRGKPGGTVIYSNNELKFVDTKTEHTISAGGYPSWHPNGKLIAFSTNKIHQKFHSVKEKYALVYDEKSDMVLYDVEKNEIQAIPKLSTADFENIPTWSPDGKYLYFLSAPFHLVDTGSYENIKYDLKRIAYDVASNTWGDVEDLLLSKDLGKSIAFPRVAADNRHVVMCLADYGYFTVYNETSDVAILDLETMKVEKPDVNSDFVESYPSWSSNGKWVMFNSKRLDGVSSRPYFAYFDNGKVHKPFILPQEDAMWNIEELNNINRPELAKSIVPLNPQKILKLVKSMPEPSSFDEESIFNLGSIKLEESESSESDYIQ